MVLQKFDIDKRVIVSYAWIEQLPYVKLKFQITRNKNKEERMTVYE